MVRFGVLGCIIGMLAACANNAPRQQQIPIAQEVAHYKANARSYYTPPWPPEDPWGHIFRRHLLGLMCLKYGFGQLCSRSLVEVYTIMGNW